MNHRIVYLNYQLSYFSALKVKDKDGKPELQVIVSFNKPEDAKCSPEFIKNEQI